jgi:argininosuccinate lyase
MTLNEEDIKSDVAYLYKQLEQIENIYKRDVKDIERKISLLRKECKHPEIKYWPDPSGNNDSCEVCQICGKEAKRL